MKPKLETVTPEIARDLLKGNTHNRRVRQSHVDFLASEMVNGRWMVTGDTIKIAPDGVIVDGQHRLLAIVQSGVTVQTFIVRDVPMAVQDNCDAGTIRIVADQFHLGGIEWANQRVGAVRTILSICCYYQNPKLGTGLARIILGEFDREIQFTLERVRSFRPGMKTWVLGTLAFALNADRNVAGFIEAFGSGENLTKGNPAKAARDWLMNGGGALRSSYRKVAIEGLFNAAYNGVFGGSISTVKRGVQGHDYFTGKKRKVVAMLREQTKQQLAANPKPAEVAS